MIADPVIRFLLIGTIPFLLLVVWWSYRAQFGAGPVSSIMAWFRGD